MADILMRELESASQIILAPPNIVTNDQRLAAETVILNFRKSKLPYNNCRYLLENCQNDYVIFQAATTIKECVVKEWSLLEKNDIESLRLFLLKYITQNISLQSFARDQILQTVAVIVKRGCIEVKKASTDQLFNDLTQLMGSGNVTMQLIACSMMTSLLNEYSSSSRTSYIGLTWEFHIRCKKFFEDHELKKVFMFCLRIVKDLVTQTAPLTTENMAVFNRLLSIIEQTLSWTFTPKHIMKRMVGSFDVTQTPVLCPPGSWRDVLLDQDFIQLFFHIHTRVHSNFEMSHHSLLSLTQLASLTGDVFDTDKSKVHYLSQYIQAFLHMLTSINLCSHESLHIANLCKNLMTLFSFNIWSLVDGELFEAFINHMTKLTCMFGCSAFLEKDDTDESDQLEAYEYLLVGWMALISGFPDESRVLLKPHAVEVFNCYLECSLGHTDQEKGVDNSASEVHEIHEDDRDKYTDQLTSIGQFANIVLPHSIPLLTKLLEDRITRLDNSLQQLHKDPHLSTPLDLLYDDLHWLILITGHVLTEDTHGETPMIRASIIKYCQDQPGTDKAATLRALTSSTIGSDSVPDVDTQVDNVVRLSGTVFRLWEVERRALGRNQLQELSPLVVSTSMWFIKRWVRFYLLPDESLYSTMSEMLLTIFGQDTTGGKWVVDYIMDKVMVNLFHWFSEERLITDSLNTLLSLVASPVRRNSVIKCTHLWDLARSEAAGIHPLNALSPSCKRLLLKALVSVGSGALDESTRDTYWKQVLMPISAKFEETLRQPNFSRICQSSQCKQQITYLLESICGVVDASNCTNSSLLFNFLRPFLPDCLKLLECYHDYDDIIPVILEIFSLLIRKQLSYLSQSDSQYLYKMCLNTIQLYSRHHVGRITLNMEDAEETKFSDISIIMEMLIGLLSKEFIDFGVDDLTSKGDTGVAISEVMLYGLNTIIPVMSTTLLRFPTLCWQYFKLITILAETYPDKFTDIPHDLLSNLMDSVDMGLHSYGDQVTKMSLEIIESLSTHCVTSSLPLTSQLHLPLSTFFQCVMNIEQSVMNMFLAATFDMDLIDVAATCFLSLICSNQEQYKKIVNDLVQSQIDDLHRVRLVTAFNHLTPPNFTPSIARPVKVAFLDRFCQFLINVRAFICVR